MGRSCSTHRRVLNEHKSRLKNFKEKTISRLRHRWEVNIKTDVKELGRDLPGIHMFKDGNQSRSAMISVILFRVP